MQSELPVRSQVLEAVSSALAERKVQDGEAAQAAHTTKQVWPSIHTNANCMHFDTGMSMCGIPMILCTSMSAKRQTFGFNASSLQ